MSLDADAIREKSAQKISRAADTRWTHALGSDLRSGQVTTHLRKERQPNASAFGWRKILKMQLRLRSCIFLGSCVCDVQTTSDMILAHSGNYSLHVLSVRDAR
jgi:hypothetical protein